MGRQVKSYRRIRDLREDHEPKLTQAYVAKEIGLHLTRYQTYERGEARVPAEVIEKLARFYHVKADYILGLTDSKR